MTAISRSRARFLKASAALRSSLSSHRGPGTSLTLTSSRKKLMARKTKWMHRDAIAGSVPPSRKSPPHFPSRTAPAARAPGRAQPGRAAAPAPPPAAVPPAPSPQSARWARNPRPAEPSPPTPSWLLTGAPFILHSSLFFPVAPQTHTPRGRPEPPYPPARLRAGRAGARRAR